MNRNYRDFSPQTILDEVFATKKSVGWNGTTLEDLEAYKKALAPFNVVYLDDFTGTWGLKPIQTPEKVEVLLVPSSDDQKEFSNCSTIDEAKELHSKDGCFTSMHEFDSVKEAEIFVMGYNSGIGYMGDGLFFSNKELNVEQV